MSRTVFITGGTGYLGRPLIEQLVAHGHAVRALTRPGSERRVPSGARIVFGDALDGASYLEAVSSADTFVHLVGTPHPNPSKAQEFIRVDLGSVRAAVAVAKAARIRHFVYVSVAYPAPVMRAYLTARQEGEACVRESGLAATVLRPWYVLGPGHRWPYLLLPLYGLLSLLPATREGARRLGLVTRAQMLRALVHAVTYPPVGVRIVEVPKIRAVGQSTDESVVSGVGG